jgi:hypothetical protein
VIIWPNGYLIRAGRVQIVFMFGVVHACRETLGDELIEQWRAHLCGLCLSLRDSRGQLSRALTNTDAVMLSVLVEAQQAAPVSRTGAGPCPLRGMRTAQVVPADAVAARLGATASMTLAAGKAGDLLAEREYALAASTLKTRAGGMLAGPLRRAALADRPMAESVHALEILDDLAQQGAVESEVSLGDDLLSVTGATSRAAGRIFASSAVLAGRPENEETLREIGAAFGSLAHLLDAVEDLEADRRSGSFNPIIATGTPVPAVRRECARLVRRIRIGFDRLILTDGRLVRALLVGGTHSALHKAFGSRRSTSCATNSVVQLGYPGQHQPDQPPTPPPDDPYQNPPDEPNWPYPAGPDGPPLPPPPPKEPPKPPFWSNVLPWVGVYCTGFACCASHQNPCTGKRHEPGCSNCDCDCCDCGDGCCCDCDCNC